MSEKYFEIASGICECRQAPMGAHCLEGYSEGMKYYYSKIVLKESKKTYYRIYPRAPIIDKDGYYETCGPRVFEKYFTVRCTT